MPIPDSLTFKLAIEQDLLNRFQVYRGIIWHYIGKSNLKEIPPYLDTLFQIALLQKNDSLWMESYYSVGVYHDLKSDSKLEIEYLLKALPIAECSYASKIPKIYTMLGSGVF